MLTFQFLMQTLQQLSDGKTLQYKFKLCLFTKLTMLKVHIYKKVKFAIISHVSLTQALNRNIYFLSFSNPIQLFSKPY